jgi:hypothetical protein
MKPARTACRTPVAFALRNFDAERSPVLEAVRFDDAGDAAMRGLKLSRKDKQVRDVVGLDEDGIAWTIELAPSLLRTRENPTGWVLRDRLDIRPARTLRLVK